MTMRNHPGQGSASWGTRVAATLVDAGVIFLIVVALVAIPALIYGDPGGWGEVGGVFVLVVAPLYFALLQAEGQTVGQRSFGIDVRRRGSLDRLGYGRAFSRALVTFFFILTGIVWIFDVLWPLWDEHKQALHDKVVGSAVVEVGARYALLYKP